MSLASAEKISRERYLALDRDAERKLEFVSGVVVAMAGASPRHNRVNLNVSSWLNSAVDERCEVFHGDQRVRIDATGAYLYPDVVVGCGELEWTDEHPRSLLDPRLVVEVISRSTADHDRGAKLAHYRKLPSVQEVVLIETDDRRVETYRRLENGQWLVTDVTEGAVELVSLGLTTELDAIYRGVERLPTDAA